MYLKLISARKMILYTVMTSLPLMEIYVHFYTLSAVYQHEIIIHPKKSLVFPVTFEKNLMFACMGHQLTV